MSFAFMVGWYNIVILLHVNTEVSSTNVLSSHNYAHDVCTSFEHYQDHFCRKCWLFKKLCVYLYTFIIGHTIWSILRGRYTIFFRRSYLSSLLTYISVFRFIGWFYKHWQWRVGKQKKSSLRFNEHTREKIKATLL